MTSKANLNREISNQIELDDDVKQNLEESLPETTKKESIWHRTIALKDNFIKMVKGRENQELKEMTKRSSKIDGARKRNENNGKRPKANPSKSPKDRSSDKGNTYATTLKLQFNENSDSFQKADIGRWTKEQGSSSNKGNKYSTKVKLQLNENSDRFQDAEFGSWIKQPKLQHKSHAKSTFDKVDIVSRDKSDDSLLERPNHSSGDHFIVKDVLKATSGRPQLNDMERRPDTDNKNMNFYPIDQQNDVAWIKSGGKRGDKSVYAATIRLQFDEDFGSSFNTEVPATPSTTTTFGNIESSKLQERTLQITESLENTSHQPDDDRVRVRVRNDNSHSLIRVKPVLTQSPTALTLTLTTLTILG
jgi:hypothetical protein